MNPFAQLESFEAMRQAALRGPTQFDRFLRARSTDERRHRRRAVALRLPPRTRRMVRLAIASSNAVLLVGPPGTGKTEILDEVISEISRDPIRFGLSRSEISALWVTPEEEWTFDSVVLGETVVNGELRSVEGRLLEAIRLDQWLVLDEANRADMDRVLGGVLTWLSGKRVRVGLWRSPEIEGRPTYLGWAVGSESELQEDSAEHAREYLAGSDWRLLGTYNAVDAQRVFRMGQALSRRFKHVPVPPVPIDEFELLIGDYIAEGPMSEALRDRVSALYAAHLVVEDAQLGPGLFTDIPAYVEHGLLHAASIDMDAAQEPIAGDGNTGDGDLASLEKPAERVGENVEYGLIDELIAEAYVISVGSIVAKFEPQILEDLGEQMLDRKALTAAAWEWVLANLAAMRA